MKQRIVIWPSDGSDVCSNVPLDVKLPCTSSNTAFVGWVDETSSADTIVAIGAVCPQESIIPVIDRLSERNPCRRRTSNEDSKGCCGDCYNCALYQSLRILGVSNNDGDSNGNDDGVTDTKQQIRQQIILYSQAEANRWHSQYCSTSDSSQQYYPIGSWQRNALRMGRSREVAREISVAIKECNGQSQELKHDKIDATKDDNDQTTIAKEKVAPREDQVASTSVERQNEDSSHALFSQSLLLHHFKSGQQQHVESVYTYGRVIPWFVMFRQARTSHKRGPILNSRMIALLLDCILGIAIGYTLFTYPAFIIQHALSLWEKFHDRQLNEGLRWLESFPAGFKLNVQLTQQMGNEVRLALMYHRQIISYLLPMNQENGSTASAAEICNEGVSSMPLALVQCLGLLTVLFGSRFFFALAFDSTRLVLLHIHYLSSLFAACQRVELSTFASLWRLFRGKKRNVLRQRSDHLKYDHMQLLLGMIMFAICLFLFTTILVYHCFFAIVNFAAELLVCGLWWCGYAIIESVMQSDYIVETKRRSRNGKDMAWSVKGMQFLPVQMSESDEISYIRSFLYSENNNSTCRDAAIPILKKKTFGCSSQERTRDLIANVSVNTKQTSTMKGSIGVDVSPTDHIVSFSNESGE